jgi:hypothetical protein
MTASAQTRPASAFSQFHARRGADSLTAP